jgi:type I restriction enzyme S subunit
VSELTGLWSECSIEDVLAAVDESGTILQQGWSPQCERSPAGDDEWAVLKTTSVQDGFFLEAENKRLPDSLAPKPNIEVEAGDLLMTCAGPRSRCGVVCLVKKTRPKLMISGKIYRFRPDPQMMEPSFFSYQLRTQALQMQIDAAKTGISESGLNLTRERFFAFRLKAPPIAEQKRIAQKLDKLLVQVDTLKARIEAIPVLLRLFRQAVLTSACLGKLTEAWRGEKNAIDLAASISSYTAILRNFRVQAHESEQARVGRKRKYSEADVGKSDGLPEIPPSWRWLSVDTLASKVVDGVHKKPEYRTSGIPFVTVKNLTAGPGISFGEIKYVSKKDHSEFFKRANPEKGDILISKDGTLGVVRQVKIDREFSIFVSVALVKPLDRAMSNYLEFAFSAPPVQAQMVGVGSGLQHIHLTDLKQDMIPVPSPEEREEIVRRVEQLFAFADQLEAKVAAAKQRIDKLTQSILAKAFRGELVPQDPNDEPASVLLERIRAKRAATPKARSTRKSVAST